MLKFRKMHGLGNDFVLFDARAGRVNLGREQIVITADRRRGIGCDQVIVLAPPSSATPAHVAMQIYNPDGSQAGACGNATRCVADIVMKEEDSDSCLIETAAGVLTCRRADLNQICVEMTRPRTGWADIPLAHACDTLHLPLDGDPVAVSMGNPHCVFFVDDFARIDVPKAGGAIEKNDLFPEGTNVEFIQILSPGAFRMRVWERGTGLTPACGSGACAALVAGVRRGLCDRRAQAILDGGTLIVEWADDHAPVLMTGPAAYVYEGSIDPERLVAQ